MKIASVSNLLSKCWESAETQCRNLIAERYYDSNEEFITKLFHGEFRRMVDEVSNRGGVEAAFLEDLRLFFPATANDYDLHGLFGGIQASVTLHPHEIEEQTGGDLSVLLVRPDVDLSSWDTSSFIVNRDFMRGLLVQAKIKRRPSPKRKSTWGAFTDQQRIVIRKRLAYLSLLLFEYEDPDRRKLMPFKWQLCSEAKDFDEVTQWLKSSRFPSVVTSQRIIEALGNDEIGTTDRRIIEEIISPPVRPALVVRLSWPPGKGPPDEGVLQDVAIEKEKHVVLGGQ